MKVSRKFIIDLIETGALDDIQEFNKMSKEEKESTILYWQENYLKDYTEKEVQELGTILE